MCFQCIHNRETGKFSLLSLIKAKFPSSSWRYELSCEKFRSEMEWISFKMLNNSIEFSCLFLPYTGEHRVGYWSKFKYNNRLDWKKRRPIGLSLNLCCDFFFFPGGVFLPLVAEGSQNSCFFYCTFFHKCISAIFHSVKRCVGGKRILAFF